MQDNSFGKETRLLKGYEFRRVYSRGKRFRTEAIFFTVAPSDSEHVRLGLTVSRKSGKAVVRNLIKRRIREAFRIKRHRFNGAFDLIASPRRDLPVPSYQMVLESFENLINRLEKEARRGKNG